MAKRFTDTDKFIDPWYRRLSTKNKLLWDWLLCYCDHAGLISLDLEFVEMVLGEKYEDNVIETHFHERVFKLGDLKYFIPKFIKFQYGELNPESRIHNSVIKKLNEHGINYKSIDTLLIPYPKTTHSLKDKEQDKEQDKNKVNTTKLVNNNPLKCDATVDKVIQLYNDTLAGVGKLKFCQGLGGQSIKSILNTFERIPTMDKWGDLFALVKANGTLTGASKTVFLATLDWLAVEDNALKVLNGKYDLPTDAEAKSKSVDDYVKSIRLG